MVIVRRVWCNLIAAVFSVALIMPITYMLLDRDIPLNLHYHIFEPDHIAPGDAVRVSWTVKLLRSSCQGTFTRRIIDAGGFINQTKPMPMTSFQILKDPGFGEITKTFVMPLLVPGPATYQVTTKYWCNPIQYYWPIVHEEDVIHFTVIGPTPPLQYP